MFHVDEADVFGSSRGLNLSSFLSNSLINLFEWQSEKPNLKHQMWHSDRDFFHFLGSIEEECLLDVFHRIGGDSIG